MERYIMTTLKNTTYVSLTGLAQRAARLGSVSAADLHKNSNSEGYTFNAPLRARYFVSLSEAPLGELG
jgi:hypothetical protein